jgi:hypothetical protein
MKRMVVGAALLALGTVAPLYAADSPSPSTYDVPWYTRWFGIGTPPPKPAPPARRDPLRDAARARAKAEADLVRRLQACTELQQVALDTNNTELANQAIELERQARELYVKRTAYLPCSKLVPTQSESIADRQPDASVPAADGLTTPAITVPTRNSQASAPRGGNP